MAVSDEKKALWRSFVNAIKKAVSEPATAANEDAAIEALDASFESLLETEGLSPESE